MKTQSSPLKSSFPKWIYGFPLIFVLIGLITLGTLLQSDAPPAWSEKWLVLISLGGGFFAGGLFFLGFFIRSHQMKIEEETLKTQYPEMPWKWRRDWAKSTVIPSDSLIAFTYLGFGLLFTLISLPMFSKIQPELAKGNYAALLGFLFPLVGVGFLIAFTKNKLRQRRFGKVIFHLKDGLGSLGGLLSGQISIQHSFPRETQFHAMLNCKHIYTCKRGRENSTRTDIKWQKKSTYRGTPLGRHTEVAVEFSLPIDTLETDSSDPSNRIVWELNVTAELSGVDFNSTFEVPVFKNTLSDEGKTSEALRQEKHEDSPVTTEGISGFSMGENKEGSLIYKMKKGNARSVGVATFIFGLIFSGIGAAIGYGAFTSALGIFSVFLWLFPIVFIGVSLILFYATFMEFFAQTYLFVREAEFEIRQVIFGFRSIKKVSFSEIERVELVNQVKSGHKLWYDIKFCTPRPKGVTVPCRIPKKEEAEWLATELEKKLAA